MKFMLFGSFVYQFDSKDNNGDGCKETNSDDVIFVTTCSEGADPFKIGTTRNPGNSKWLLSEYYGRFF